ncbi:MAG: TRAP transporter large permease [Alkalilacustris sp.]
MDLALWMFPVLIAFILIGFPIAFALIATSLIFGWIRFEWVAVHQFMSKVDDVSSNYVLGAIPLFIFMGAMLERSGIAERLFDAIYIWTRRLPGGLAVGAILMCVVFAMASGITGAVEAVVGLLAIPAMMKYGYDKRLISGTICAGGSLGTSIPPSVTVIVLAPAANMPVGNLFAGMMFPGLVMAGLFIVLIMGACVLRPSLAPREASVEDDDRSFLLKLRITLVALVPPVILILAVLGTILGGIATPTEAAACGAVGSAILALVYGRLTLEVLKSALFRTLMITAMILLIVLGGSMFAGVFFATGGMGAIQSLIRSIGLEGWMIIAAILLVTFVAAFVLEILTVVIIIIPIAMPLVMMSGVDPLWFCILFLLVLQTGYLTPPMAPSVFYLRAIAPPEITLRHMYWGVLPFILVQLVTLALVIYFPALATWLPAQLY